MDLHLTKYLKEPLEVVDLSGTLKMQLGHVPIEQVISDELDVSGDPLRSQMTGFFVMSSAAAYHAQLYDIESLALGVIEEQNEGRDLRLAFTKLAETVNLFNPMIDPIEIHLPLLKMTKVDVIREAKRLGVPLENCWSCFDVGPKYCGSCSSCVERQAAFKNANLADPTVYES